jgi:hypothetical protein
LTLLGTDRLSLCRALRVDGPYSPRRVYALSARPDALSIGDELSLDGVLVKPVDMTKFERFLVDIAREDARLLSLTYAEPRDVDLKQFGKVPALGCPGHGHAGAPKSYVVLRYAKALGHAFRSHLCPFEGHV